MPNNWKTYKLSEVTKKIGSGATPRGGHEAYKSSGVSLIRSQNVLDFSFSTNGLAFIDDEQASKLNNVTLEEDDVLLNITGDSVARVCQVTKELLPARVNQHVAIIRADNKTLNSTYLKYSLLEASNKNALLSLASAGATRQAITKSMIEGFELKLPFLLEQQSIASILSTIDNKIENNLAINKTLEEMAMVLYKHWFVDFGPFKDGEFVESELGLIPKGWEIVLFEKIVSKYIDNRGKTPPIEDEGIPLLEVKHISSNLFPDLKVQKYVSKSTYDNWFRNHLKEDDIIISTVGTVGLTSLVPTFSKVTIAQNLLGLRFDKNKYPTGFMFYLMKSPYFLNQIENRLVITVQKSIKRSDLDKIPCLIPSQNLINLFNELVVGYINQIENNLTENQTLTQLRDTLLPKLISGEVRLKEFREN